MTHGNMDRSKQERESWDVTHGPHIRGDLNSLCAKAMAACSTLPLLLGKEGDAALYPGLVSPLLPAPAIKARHSSDLANQLCKKFLVAPYGSRQL